MIGFLVAGLIIGALARLVRPGKQSLGILATLGLGLVGSLIGGLVARLLGTGGIWELNVVGFVLAVISAVLISVLEADPASVSVHGISCAAISWPTPCPTSSRTSAWSRAIP